MEFQQTIPRHNILPCEKSRHLADHKRLKKYETYYRLPFLLLSLSLLSLVTTTPAGLTRKIHPKYIQVVTGLFGLKTIRPATIRSQFCVSEF